MDELDKLRADVDRLERQKLASNDPNMIRSLNDEITKIIDRMRTIRAGWTLRSVV